MRLVNVVTVACAIALGCALAALAAENTQKISCAKGDVCTLELDAGHYRIYTPTGQMIRPQEINNETGYMIETWPAGG